MMTFPLYKFDRWPYKKRSYRKHTENIRNIQKIYKKCAPYGNCTEIVQKIYRKCAKICNNSNNEPVSTNELLQNLTHFLYIFCTISVQFPYVAHFLYVFCMFSVRSFFIGRDELILKQLRPIFTNIKILLFIML